MIEKIKAQPMVLKDSCHNQRVDYEYHVKVVTEAEDGVGGRDHKDAIIQQKLYHTN